MPKITVHIAEGGTELNLDDGSSKAGHMWITTENGESYGFAPLQSEQFGPGKIYTNDESNYKSTLYEKTIEVTDSQYKDMIKFMKDPANNGFSLDYNAYSHSCVDFVWKALEKGGINTKNFEGDVVPSNNVDDLKKLPSKTPEVDNKTSENSSKGPPIHRVSFNENSLNTQKDDPSIDNEDLNINTMA